MNATSIVNLLGRKVLITIGVAGLATLLTLVLKAAGANSVIVFVISAVALANSVMELLVETASPPPICT